MKNHISKIFFLIIIFFISCDEKKDIIEIYLTKKQIESYDGVSLKVGIKDSVKTKIIIERFGSDTRIDTINDKLIYMGHFSSKQNDLEDIPFINDSEIIGFDFEKSEIHLKKSVTEKIYNSIPNWRKKNILGKQFVLCHNKKIILNGYFLGSMSSVWSNTFQILYHKYPEYKRKNNIKSVVFSMHDSINFEKNNLKKNKELYNAFRNRLID